MFGFGRKSADSSAAKLERVMKLNGMYIKYVTERRDDMDVVVGRGGSISIRRGELILFSSDKILLRADTSEVDASNLMSGDGVVLTAPNREEDGKVRTYIAHFVYYRS